MQSFKPLPASNPCLPCRALSSSAGNRCPALLHFASCTVVTLSRPPPPLSTRSCPIFLISSFSFPPADPPGHGADQRVQIFDHAHPHGKQQHSHGHGPYLFLRPLVPEHTATGEGKGEGRRWGESREARKGGRVKGRERKSVPPGRLSVSPSCIGKIVVLPLPAYSLLVLSLSVPFSPPPHTV